jgi:hypothetical protein
MGAATEWPCQAVNDVFRTLVMEGSVLELARSPRASKSTRPRAVSDDASRSMQEAAVRSYARPSRNVCNARFTAADV